MKITDVTLTPFAWTGIPVTRYGPLDQNGFVNAMNEPGLGARIDFDLAECQKTTVLR